jgi:hypothetical protein
MGDRPEDMNAVSAMHQGGANPANSLTAVSGDDKIKTAESATCNKTLAVGITWHYMYGPLPATDCDKPCDDAALYHTSVA